MCCMFFYPLHVLLLCPFLPHCFRTSDWGFLGIQKLTSSANSFRSRTASLSPCPPWWLRFSIISCIVNARWEHIILEQLLHIIVPVEYVHNLFQHIIQVFLLPLPRHCASMSARIKEFLPQAAATPLSSRLDNVDDLRTGRQWYYPNPVISFIVLFLKRRDLHHFEIATTSLQLHHSEGRCTFPSCLQALCHFGHNTQ